MANAMFQQPGVTKAELKELVAEKTKILLVGDVHLSDKPPSSCTDAYLDDILDMLTYVGKLGKAMKVDAVVIAGDMFHHKQGSRTSHSTIMKTIRVLREIDNLYIVAGNHDIQSDRLETIRDRQPLGVLFEAGVATELNGWHPQLPIFGVPWQQRWLDEDAPEDAFKGWRERWEKVGTLEPKAEKYLARHYGDRAHSLVITHAPIYPPGDELEFEFVPTEGEHGISKAMGNEGFVYYGHIHEPHGIFKADGVVYANMGALSRGSLHEYNLQRKIQISVWTPDSGFHAIDIPHKPASEVFRLAEAVEKKAEKLSLDSFLSQVGSATLDISSTETVIAHIRGLDVEEPVKKTSIELLEEVS